ncbi:MAG: hypothetical protein LBT43_01990 [Prevotella sp.]|jgi:hypothetical protein|nr:hypothetical protein [Prevotella sp.]
MMDITEAKVVVTTQREIDNDSRGGDWFYLSDYGDMGEFYTACDNYFPEESNPVFRYPAWENIPDILINNKWFCPNFFEIRDAMERLDEQETDHFLAWCNYHGHDITVDDPYLLVTNYRDNHASCPEFENDTMEIPDDALACQSITGSFFDIERNSLEVFDDNYD